MDKIKLIQNIGNEVCEECGPEADCGINPADCSRIDDATILLDQYISQDACACGCAAMPDGDCPEFKDGECRLLCS